MVSGSGGLEEPSTLSCRAFANRAVIASREGIFLYPAGTFSRFLSFSLSTSWFSFSSLSVVNGSPFSEPTGVEVLLRGGEADNAVGEVDLVLGALTTMESEADAPVADEDSEVCDPVRRREAARRGRTADEELVGAAFRLIRAASWFREGIRTPAEGRSGFGALTVGTASVELDIVADDEQSRNEQGVVG